MVCKFIPVARTAREASAFGLAHLEVETDDWTTRYSVVVPAKIEGNTFPQVAMIATMGDSMVALGFSGFGLLEKVALDMIVFSVYELWRSDARSKGPGIAIERAQFLAESEMVTLQEEPCFVSPYTAYKLARSLPSESTFLRVAGAKAYHVAIKSELVERRDLTLD